MSGSMGGIWGRMEREEFKDGRRDIEEVFGTIETETTGQEFKDEVRKGWD